MNKLRSLDTSELSSSLRVVVSALHKGLRKQLSGINNYSMTELETIAHLSRSAALLPTELAALARVKTQSMSHILNKLEEQKVIKRSPSKQDKRKIYISLTAFGKNKIEKTRYERDEWLKKMIEATLTDKEKEVLARAIPLLNKLIVTK